MASTIPVKPRFVHTINDIYFEVDDHYTPCVLLNHPDDEVIYTGHSNAFVRYFHGDIKPDNIVMIFKENDDNYDDQDEDDENKLEKERERNKYKNSDLLDIRLIDLAGASSELS